MNFGLKRIAALVLACLLICSFSGCKEEEENIPGSSGIVFEEIEMDLAEFETSAGKLYYPEKWASAMQISEEEAEGAYRITFKTTVNSKEYVLFTVIIGGSEGDLVGSLSHGGAKNNVYVEISDLGDLSDLDTQTQDKLYAMQESINVIIENLK